MKKTIEEWIEIAEYDLNTAEAMLKTERYLYVAFMCQQSLEKILKAVYVHNKNEIPPRTHNLLYLLDVLKIKMEGDNLNLLSYLNQFYLESRYPGERIELARTINKEKAQEILEKAKGAFKCLKQKLQ